MKRCDVCGKPGRTAVMACVGSEMVQLGWLCKAHEAFLPELEREFLALLEGSEAA